MIQIAKIKNIEVDFLLAPRNYTLLYSRINTLVPLYAKHFSKPHSDSSFTTWYLEGNLPQGKLTTFDELNEDDKANVSDLIESIENNISEILKKDTEFKEFFHSLFFVPSFSNIHIVLTEAEPFVVFSGWGCVSNSATSSPNAFKIAQNYPKPNRSRVLVEVVYSDGDIAKNKELYFSYKDSQKIIKTDDNGKRDLGIFKDESLIYVYNIIKGEKKHIHEHIISKEKEICKVVFPKYANGIIKVVNDKNESMPGFNIRYSHNEENESVKTDDLGIYTLLNLEVGKEVSISENDNLTNVKTYVVENEDNEFILKIHQDIYGVATIKVTDQFDTALLNQDIIVHYKNKEKEETSEFNSGDTGYIQINDILIGSEIKAVEKKNLRNEKTYQYDEISNDFVFVIPIHIPENRTITIALIDKKRKPIQYEEISVFFREQEFTLKTDENGKCYFEALDINVGEEFKILKKFEKKRTYSKLKYINPK